MRPWKRLSGSHPAPLQAPRQAGPVPAPSPKAVGETRSTSNRSGVARLVVVFGLLAAAQLSLVSSRAFAAGRFSSPSGPSGSGGQGGPTIAEAMSSLGLDVEDRARVLRGEIVVVDVPRVRDNELSVGAAMLIDAPPELVLRSLESGRALDADEAVQVHGRIDPVRVELEGFPESAPDHGLALELHSLLRIKPGSRFNFSVQETEALRSASREARLGRSQRHPAVAAALQEAWRGVLQERFRSYLERGLVGVAAYDRGNEASSRPSSELAAAVLAEPLLAERASSLRAALSGPPGSSGSLVRHRFLWLQQSVERRTQFVLIHQAALREGEFRALVERQFFVGHTYNSLQAFTACIPFGEQTLVVHTNRTFTDAILGLAERIAQRVGQRRLRAEVFDDAERLRVVVAGMPVERLARRAGSPGDHRLR